MKINLGTSVKNKYSIQCIDSKTDKVKYDLHFHNVVLNQIVNLNAGRKPPSYQIHIGNGTGTPSSTDTKLFNQIKSVSASCSNSKTDDDYTLKKTLSYTFPASIGEEYNITEIGVGLNGILITHALVLDSEGNPISIEKTDTDIVIITAEVYFTFNKDISILDKTVIGEGYGFYNTIWNNNGIMKTFPGLTFSPEAELTNSVRMDESDDGSMGGFWNVPCSSSFQLGSPLYASAININERKLIYNYTGKRIKYSIPQSYLKGVTLPGYGVIKLPNEDFFPVRKLENITIGVGDGETKEFKCPLNYFKKDTDTIYIGKVPKIKGIDYTIDNENNVDELVELSAGNDAVITGGVIGNTFNAPPIFRRLVCNITSSVTGNERPGNQGIYGFTSDSPLFFDFQVKRKINLLRTPTAAPTELVLELYGRDAEDAEWENIVTFNRNAKTDVYCSFDTVEYRYIKLTTNKSCFTTQVGRVSWDWTSNYSISKYFDTEQKCKDNMWFLGYKGDNIKFTTAPPEGSIITMDADTDLPILSSNSVIDSTFRLEVQM